MEIKLELNKDINYNANKYFEKAKKLKNKLPGIEKTIEKTKKEIENKKEELLKKKEILKTKEIINQTKHKEWFDKFRWTKTLSNKLFVIGKDATTNEILIKKYLEETDLILHSQAPGSPFGIIKNALNKDKEIIISKEEILNAMQFLLCFSKQWKNGFGTADAFYVKPEQISKTPNSGEFMSKGSFMIKGEKNIIKNIPLQIGIGIIEKKINIEEKEIKYYEIFSSDSKTIKYFCKKYLILEPGNLKYKALNKLIKKELKIPVIEDLPKYIPNDCKINKKLSKN
jgi:predicted ribosome quality control (RQC) complex YloA/Tae2 family protein